MTNKKYIRGAVLFYSLDHDAAFTGALQSLRNTLLDLRLRDEVMKDEKEENLGGGHSHLYLGLVPPSFASEKPASACPVPLPLAWSGRRGRLPRLLALYALHLGFPCLSLDRHNDLHVAAAGLQFPLLSGIIHQSLGTLPRRQLDTQPATLGFVTRKHHSAFRIAVGAPAPGCPLLCSGGR